MNSTAQNHEELPFLRKISFYWGPVPYVILPCCFSNLVSFFFPLSVFFLLPLSLFLSFHFMNVHFSVCAERPFLEADLLTLAVAHKSMASCRPLLELR